MAAAGDINPDSIGVVLKRQFDKDVRIERVLAARGDNRVVDAVAFRRRASRPARKVEMLDALEWAYDRGSGGSRRCARCRHYRLSGGTRAQWVEQLRATHKVKVNKKVLKSVKQHLNVGR